MPFIYHIITPADWASAQKNGDHRPESLESENFIHCSTEKQIAAVANAFYSGQKGLQLLVIETEKISALLKWEAPSDPAPNKPSKGLHGEFPHIYGPLNLDAVVDVLDFSPNEDWLFTFPTK